MEYVTQITILPGYFLIYYVRVCVVFIMQTLPGAGFSLVAASKSTSYFRIKAPEVRLKILTRPRSSLIFKRNSFALIKSAMSGGTIGRGEEDGENRETAGKAEEEEEEYRVGIRERGDV